MNLALIFLKILPRCSPSWHQQTRVEDGRVVPQRVCGGRSYCGGRSLCGDGSGGSGGKMNDGMAQAINRTRVFSRTGFRVWLRISIGQECLIGQGLGYGNRMLLSIRQE